MAFGTFFKKLGSRISNFANKATNAIMEYGPKVSKVVKKLGPIGQTIGGAIDGAVDVSKIINNHLSKFKGLDFDAPKLK